MPVVRCPICDRPFAPETTPAMPFCSRRCKRIDRNRWLAEQYGLPCEPEEERFGDDPDCWDDDPDDDA